MALKMPGTTTLYKYGAILIFLVAFGWGCWYKGKMDCNIAHEKAATVAAQVKTETIIKEVEVRVPVVQRIEVESAKQRAAIKSLTEKLDHALNDRPENPSCDLSDAEFNSVQDLASKTRP